MLITVGKLLVLFMQYVFAVNAAALESSAAKNVTSALTALLQNYYYHNPNVSAGTFQQSYGPWWESATIWETFMDYARYTGSHSFMNTVGIALTSASFNETHDLLGKNHTYVSIKNGRWNDDIEWYAQAVIAGAEILGSKSIMPGPSGNGNWISLAQKTIDEVYAYRSDKCGGGIIWSRDPSQAPTYKSSITNIEFISLGARTAIQTKNSTLLGITEKLFDWLARSGVINLKNGIVNDGLNADTCVVSKDQWSYTYGMLLGGLGWLYRATGNSTYLSYAAPFLNNSIREFAPSGVIRENCEQHGTCDNNQASFKGIYLRNIVYLYGVTTDKAVKANIQNVVRKSAAAAVATCTSAWSCKGGWANGTQQYPAFRALGLVAAALVAESGLTS